MAECNGQKKCGCIDKGLHTLCPVCNPVNCPEDPNACAEVFCDQCIVHCGPAIPELYIEEGDTIYEILQTLGTDAECKRMIMNLRTTLITSTAIHVAWENEGILDIVDGEMSVQYAEDIAGPWLENEVVQPPVNTSNIGNALTPDTDYFIKLVITIVPHPDLPTTCDSVIIKVKTQPSTA